MIHFSMIHQTKAENRATVIYCARHGWCSVPDYARQDREIAEAKEEKLRHRHTYNALGNCSCGSRNWAGLK